jgi:hypothetical protein
MPQPIFGALAMTIHATVQQSVTASVGAFFSDPMPVIARCGGSN